MASHVGAVNVASAVETVAGVGCGDHEERGQLETTRNSMAKKTGKREANTDVSTEVMVKTRTNNN